MFGATRLRRLAGLLASLTMTAVPAVQADSADEAFERSVRPVLVRECQACHSGAKPAGGMAMDRDGREAGRADRIAMVVSSGKMPPSRFLPNEVRQSLVR